MKLIVQHSYLTKSLLVIVPILKQKGKLHVILTGFIIKTYFFSFLIAFNILKAWLLRWLIPFMIGSFIPESDDHYRNYLLMLEITDYLMAPKISEDDVSYLKLLIEDHHTTFLDLYPQSSVIPKIDVLLYYIHMPKLTLK